MQSPKFRLQLALEKRRQQGLIRTRRQRSEPAGGYDFSSNDYLGLARDDCYQQAVIDQVTKLGFGSTGSQYLSGFTSAHAALEARLAEFVGADAALLFSSGYLANIGCLAALASRKDTVLADRLVHASIIDGIQLGNADLKRFRHNDLEDLQARAEAYRPVVTVVEGLYSMDGDCAPLAGLLDIEDSHTGMVYLDDAHAFGISGPNGRGSLAAIDRVPAEHLILMAGLGKALGAAGAFVAGDYEVIEFLRQFARTAIYSTSLPVSVVAACSINLERMQKDEWRRDKLFENIDWFRSQAGELAGLMSEAQGPIQSVLIGNSEQCVALSEKLYEQGLMVPAIRPPTVPNGTARLRISLNSVHQKSDITRLVRLLQQSLPD